MCKRDPLVPSRREDTMRVLPLLVGMQLLLAAAASGCVTSGVRPPSPEASGTEAPTSPPPPIVDTDAMFPPLERTYARSRIARAVLRDYFAANGHYPVRLRDALDLEPSYPVSPYMDGWERPWLYQRTEFDYELRSAGADGLPDTSDDIVFTSRADLGSS